MTFMTNTAKLLGLNKERLMNGMQGTEQAPLLRQPRTQSHLKPKLLQQFEILEELSINY